MRVARYLFWRVVRGVLTLLTMIAITFTLYFAVETTPPVGDYFMPVSRGIPATPAEIATVRHLFYLDRSKIGLFVHYVGHLARGDFGTAQTINEKGQVVDLAPVGPPYVRAAGETLSILIGGAVVVLLLALPLGAITGSRIGSWTDRIVSFLALVLVCTHPMMLGLILRSAGGNVHWLPTYGYCPLFPHHVSAGPSLGPTCGGVRDWSSHLLLPWLTFGLLFLALYTRMVRASVVETIHEDFVRTARAKGASQTRVLTRHVLPSSALRVLTMVGMEIGTAIGVCIYIESAFSIYGLGSASVAALSGSADGLNLPIDLAIVVLITLIVVVGNLAVDLLYAVFDPRVGIQQRSTRSKSLVGGVF
jgi:peptide/nickel transport system permease protein